jgi:hypothetical protein
VDDVEKFQHAEKDQQDHHGPGNQSENIAFALGVRWHFLGSSTSRGPIVAIAPSAQRSGSIRRTRTDLQSTAQARCFIKIVMCAGLPFALLLYATGFR